MESAGTEKTCTRVCHSERPTSVKFCTVKLKQERKTHFRERLLITRCGLSGGKPPCWNGSWLLLTAEQTCTDEEHVKVTDLFHRTIRIWRICVPTCERLNTPCCQNKAAHQEVCHSMYASLMGWSALPERDCGAFLPFAPPMYDSRRQNIWRRRQRLCLWQSSAQSGM